MASPSSAACSVSSRYELDAFLKDRGVWLEYTLEDFRSEGEITTPLLAQRTEKSEHKQPARL